MGRKKKVFGLCRLGPAAEEVRRGEREGGEVVKV